jgi:hypothetical protein
LTPAMGGQGAVELPHPAPETGLILN